MAGWPSPSLTSKFPLWPTRPMLATRTTRPFDNPEWIFEVKWDGVRCLLHLSQGEARLQSRSLRDVTAIYPEIASASEEIDASAAVIDGEIVALDDSNRPSFELLQQRINLHSPDEIEAASERIPTTLYSFDLLYLDGESLMNVPIEERKNRLRRILRGRPRLEYSDHVEGDGVAFYRKAEEMGLEGVVAKRKGSIYQPGIRSSDWLKIRIEIRDEFVIGGWTRGKGGRSGSIGALLLGKYEGGRLRYVGKVGTGFDFRQLSDLSARLRLLETRERPFIEDPGEPHATWAEPRLVCEVRFSRRSDGSLRFPVFLGLREDKKSCEVTEQRPVPPPSSVGRVEAVGKVKLTNGEKVFWPQRGYTKRDVFEYYIQVAPFILPHLRDRPITLYRQPDGIGGGGFYQRNRPDFAPEWIRSVRLERPGHAAIESIMCDDTETLAWIVNIGCIEIHPWLSRVDSLEMPDYIVFDLDPVEPAGFTDACEAALHLRDVLQSVGFKPYVKTSGKRGLHVFLSIKRNLTFDQTRAFAQSIAQHLEKVTGGKVTTAKTREEKRGKVFLDPAQNAWGRSLAAPYSVRSTPDATVSAPITWRECERCVEPGGLNMRSLPGRLSTMGDPWRNMQAEKQDVQEILG